MNLAASVESALGASAVNEDAAAALCLFAPYAACFPPAEAAQLRRVHGIVAPEAWLNLLEAAVAAWDLAQAGAAVDSVASVLSTHPRTFAATVYLCMYHAEKGLLLEMVSLRAEPAKLPKLTTDQTTALGAFLAAHPAVDAGAVCALARQTFGALRT